MITIGIDLGTTNSCAAFYDGRFVQMISLPDGGHVLPSAVSQTKTGSMVVGDPALDQVMSNTEYTFRHMKRQMGRRWNDDIDMGSAQLTESGEGFVAYKGRDGEVFTPEALSALVLKELKDAAEDQLDMTVDGVVVTVPAYFNDQERSATEKAAKLAGFERVELLHEPLAAAIASGIDMEGYNRIFVFDLGGGTFDVAVLETGRGDLTPLDTNGEKRLGGVDFDGRIVDWLVEQHKEKHGQDLSVRPIPMLALAYQAEKAKKRLTRFESAEISIGNIDMDETGAPIGITETLTREHFNQLVRQEVGKALNKTAEVLKGAKRSKAEIEHIVLVGGMTRMPLVQDAVSAFFDGKAPRKTIDADEIVARGAAMYAARKDNRTTQFDYTDILSMPYGVEVPGGGFLIVHDSGEKVGSRETVQFTNVRGGMTEIAVGLYQGVSAVAVDNHFMGTYRCPIEPGDAETAELNITFEVTDSGGLRLLNENDEPLWQGDQT